MLLYMFWVSKEECLKIQTKLKSYSHPNLSMLAFAHPPPAPMDIELVCLGVSFHLSPLVTRDTPKEEMNLVQLVNETCKDELQIIEDPICRIPCLHINGYIIPPERFKTFTQTFGKI